MAGGQAPAHGGWVVGCSPRVPGFLWGIRMVVAIGVARSAPIGSPWSSCPCPAVGRGRGVSGAGSGVRVG